MMNWWNVKDEISFLSDHFNHHPISLSDDLQIVAEQQGDIQKAQEFQRQIDELDNKTDRLVSGDGLFRQKWINDLSG